MEENTVQNVGIDYRQVIQEILKRKRLFLKTLPIAFIFSSIYIFSIPRYYHTETTMAPETENPLGGGTIGSIASTFGIDLGEMETSDAITPLLYPDLMEDNGFVSSLFNIQIRTKDGNIQTNYHDYLEKHQKSAWWNLPISWIKSLLKKKEIVSDSHFDPYNLSEKENDIVKKISEDIKFKTDKKTGVISISVESQDPLVCKIVADSVKERLQAFITDYRTNKARTDYEYYKQLSKQAKDEYIKSRQKYANYSDANTKIALKSVELIAEDMENDMQLKFNTYSTVNNQLQLSKAKVQEKTPAFTTIKGASVPIKPAGPKRMIFVLLMLILTFIGTTGYILYDIVRPKKGISDSE